MSAALTLSMDEATLARLDALAADRQMSRETVMRLALADYLEVQRGDNLPPLQDWQTDQISEGLAAAERGDFASDDDVERVFAKYRR